jgi:transcriptional regulator with XRE-family HTH domain
MLLSERIKEIMKEKGFKTKHVVEKSGLSERTVTNILAGKDGVYLDSLVRVAYALDVPIDELFKDSKATVGGKTFTELQRELDAVTIEKETLLAEKDLIVTENTVLQGKITALTAEIDLLKMQLLHKEELLAVHNYYLKRQG